ncbi:MAG TPA: VOC family protein [Chitinophagales bacterium]|nr:VOC family protein [Chitinophagales bacterium]
MSGNSSRIAHLGGTFIYSKNPAQLAGWYKDNLGIEYTHSPEFKAWYASFYYREENSGKRAYVAWSILENKNRPEFEGKVFCINYRVNNLEMLVSELKSKGIAVKGIETYPEGKFAWVNDPDGNYIELWEDTVL